MLKPEILSRKTIYQSKWIRLHVDRVRFPAGHIAEEHHFLDFPNEGAAVIVTNEKDEVLLIESYRYIQDSVDWELPAGSFSPATEKAEDAARREALEETGYSVGTLDYVYTYYPLTGVSNCIFHIFQARAAEKTGEFDPNEVRRIRWFSRTEIQDLLSRRKIKDGFAVTGLMFYLHPLPVMPDQPEKGA